MLPEITLFLALVTFSAQKVGPCDLMDRATASALLGQASAPGMLAGPERDDDTGGTLSFCTFRAGTAGLILSQVTFSTAAEAGKATTQELVLSRMEGQEGKIVEEPGLGDRAYWAYTTEGAEIVVLKGSVVLGVALGGQLANPPASYRKALHAATAAVLLKL
jgi:hypothetical protein